jgi:hypothetical protein
VPTVTEETSSDQDQYYFKKYGTKGKADDPKVTGSLDVRINRK